MIEPEAMAAIFAKFPTFLHSFAPMPLKPVAREGKPGLQEFMAPRRWPMWWPGWPGMRR